ncbi:MAG: hypothetical protein FWD17_13820 [Polyangiaceae bacterium]|nr:hypothetical protein [Polyangiaceae bacterium]
MPVLLTLGAFVALARVGYSKAWSVVYVVLTGLVLIGGYVRQRILARDQPRKA